MMLGKLVIPFEDVASLHKEKGVLKIRARSGEEVRMVMSPFMPKFRF